MKHRLDFVEITILPNNIIELIVDNGAVLTIEKLEEIHKVLGLKLTQDFAFLFNDIHEFTVPFDVRMIMASHEKLKAIAFVYYSEECKLNVEKLIELRKIDNWNVKIFSGLEMEWQKAYDWLNNAMNAKG